MSKTLHLAAKDSDLRRIHGNVGLLCEFAKDSPVLGVAESCIGSEDLLGSPDEALIHVHPLVSKLLNRAPRFEGFPPLSIFEETLLEQFSYIAQGLHLDRWIEREGFSDCRFLSYTPWIDRLRDIRQETGSTYELHADVSVLQTSRHSRAIQRLCSSRPTPHEFFRRVMPLWSRYSSGILTRKRAAYSRTGGVWFYSTAYNYTKIGLEYEPYMPGPLNYLVEDAATGGKRLQELGREWHELYSWARASDVPSSGEVRSMGEAVTAAISSVPLSETESTLRTVFLNSEWWQLFLERRLPFLIFNSRVLQRWNRFVKPELIVVGNPGYERVLLMNDNVQAPAVMLQHGIMHWVFAVADQPVDTFIVRGPFFRGVLNENLRRKTVVLNFPEPKRSFTPGSHGTRDSILFITTPYHVPQLYHDDDRGDIMRSLVRVAHSTGRRLLIRVHPMERVADYQEELAKRQAESGLQVEASYSQGPGVEEVLARACVAVLHFSTIFLDCLRHGIPIVSFAWHWFPNQRAFEAEGVFNFARDLRHFEELVQKGTEGNLPCRSIALEHFLAETEPGSISSFLQKVWSHRSSREGVRDFAAGWESSQRAGLRQEGQAAG